MKIDHRLPYALLLVAVVTIIWLLMEDPQSQPAQSNVVDELILDRLQQLESELKSLKATPPQVAVNEANNPEADNDVKVLLARIKALEAREAEGSGRGEAQEEVSDADFQARMLEQLNQLAEREPPAAKAHFEAANSLSPSHEVELEDVEDIFESEELPNTSVSSVDCREGYCRMEYKMSDSGDFANKEIEENELLLKLGEKYGSGTKVFMGDSTPDGSKEIFIEFPKEK